MSCTAICRPRYSFHALQDGRCGGSAIAIKRHAVAGGDRTPRTLHLTLAGAMLKLQHRFRNPIEPAGRTAGLTGRHHATPSVDRLAALADLAAGKSREVMNQD